MLRVTMVFTVLLTVLIVPSAITQQALLFPNKSNSSVTIKDLFFVDYYRLYGELFIGLSQGESAYLVWNNICIYFGYSRKTVHQIKFA